MKKVNFFKVMSAALAFAAVTFTGCSEEEMTIDTPDVNIEAQPLPAAMAQASVTVYDAATMQILATELIDVTAKAGSTASIACPVFETSAKYVIPADVTIGVPAVVPGQVAILPVNFYVAGIGTAEAAVLAALIEDNVTEKVVEEVALDNTNSKLSAENESPYDKTFNFWAKAYEEDQTIVVTSRAATTAEDVLLACESFATEFKTKEWKWNYELYAYHFVNFDFKQEITTKTYEFNWNGSLQTVTLSSVSKIDLKVKEQGVIEKFLHEWNHGHTHSHGHGHGHGSNNAGGGIVWAE